MKLARSFRIWLVLGAALGGNAFSVRAMSAELAPCPSSPNCVSSCAEPEDTRHFIEPFALREPLDESWEALRRLVEGLPRATAVARTQDALHVEIRTRLLRFRDDLEVVRASAGRRVDVRSASRVGYSDLGANRARVESLRERLRREGIIE